MLPIFQADWVLQKDAIKLLCRKCRLQYLDNETERNQASVVK